MYTTEIKFRAYNNNCNSKYSDSAMGSNFKTHKYFDPNLLNILRIQGYFLAFTSNNNNCCFVVSRYHII